MDNKTIWTIGHSTHSLDEFISMLTGYRIERLVDIRSFPGSKWYPHFNKEALMKTLPEHQVEYVHMKELGGRRKTTPDSENTAWRVPAFRGYADYMQTEEFKTAIGKLQEMAIEKRVAYMCSEAVWWRCHRALVSDYLKVRGWTINHIMSLAKSTEHSYTGAARVENGKLFYNRW